MTRPLKSAVTVAACAAVAACGVNRAKAPGRTPAAAFRSAISPRIEVAGPYDVQVRTGGKAGVSVKGPENVIDQMVVEVDGNELQIRQKKGKMFRYGWGKHSTVTVEVTAPSLEGAAIAGSGDMKVDKVKGPAFQGAVAGSGSLSLASLEVETLKLDIAGSGDINAAGKANDADYSIAGSGSVKSPKVTSQTLKVSIAGSGDVAAHATGTANISIVGSGDVTVTGGAKCTVSKMGSGDANCS